MLDKAGGEGPDTGISEVPGIHRFSHQSGRGEGSGGLSTDKFNGFSARVFLDMSQEALILNILEFLGQTWVWDGVEIKPNLDGQTWWCFELPW